MKTKRRNEILITCPNRPIANMTYLCVHVSFSGGRGVAQNDYPEGKYIDCRVLGGDKWNTGMVEVSLRESRLKGNMDDDRIPNTNETANAYVVSTTSKGCFVRLSRLVEGRVILKELSDEFIPNPSTVFPPGRLIVGKVKNIKESHKKTKKGIAPITFVDMDLRESVLLASGDRVTMDDVQENLKYTGVITRVESYGVFVRIDNSDISGLAMYVILHRYIKGFTEIINFNNNLYKTNFTSNNKSPPSTTSLADPSILLIHRHSLYFYYVYDHPVFSYVHQHYHYPSSYWLPHGNSNIHFHNGIHLGNSIYKFWFD